MSFRRSSWRSCSLIGKLILSHCPPQIISDSSELISTTRSYINHIFLLSSPSPDYSKKLAMITDSRLSKEPSCSLNHYFKIYCSKVKRAPIFNAHEVQFGQWACCNIEDDGSKLKLEGPILAELYTYYLILIYYYLIIIIQLC